MASCSRFEAMVLFYSSIFSFKGILPKAFKSDDLDVRETWVFILFGCQIEARDDCLEDALGSLRLQVCGKPLLTQTSLYEAYAWKHGQQSTGSVESLMEFISRVRLLEANGYAVRKNFVKKKYKDDTARKNIEIRKIDTRMEETKACEDPAIAKAMSRMVDHQGWSVLKNASLEHGKNTYIYLF